MQWRNVIFNHYAIIGQAMVPTIYVSDLLLFNTQCGCSIAFLREQDSLLLGGTLQMPAVAACASFQRFRSSSILEALVGRTKLAYTLFPSADSLSGAPSIEK